MAISPDVLTTLIVTGLTSVTALITAIHSHSKATGATDTANTSQALSKNVTEIGTALIGLLGAMKTAPGSPVVVAPAPQDPNQVLQQLLPYLNLPAGDESPQATLDALIGWLAQQHKNTTGQNPGGTATTDFSKVLDEISRIRGGVR